MKMKMKFFTLLTNIYIYIIFFVIYTEHCICKIGRKKDEERKK